MVAGGLAGCLSLEDPAEVTVQPGDFVVVDWNLSLASGGTTSERDVHLVLAKDLPQDPEAFPEGWDPNATRTAVPGLVEAMDGMRVGETRSTGWLSPKQAFGPHRPEWVDRFDRVTGLARTVDAPVRDGTVEAYGRSWNASMRNGSAHLEVGPGDVGAVVAHPAFWGPDVRMWRSEVTGFNDTHLQVRHRVQTGEAVTRGTVSGRVVSVNETAVVVDRNPPLAGERVAFDVTVREIAFAEPGRARAPGFSVATLDGSRFSLADHRGRPVLVYFFATWCTVCKAQSPRVVEAADRLGGNATVLALSIDPNERVSDVRDYERDHGDPAGSRGVVFAVDDRGSTVSNTYTVVSIPKTVLVDAGGFFAWTETGVVPTDEMVRRVRQAASS